MENKCEHRIATFNYYGSDNGLCTKKEIIDILKEDIEIEYNKYVNGEKNNFNFSQKEFLDCHYGLIQYEFIDYCPDCGKDLDCETNFSSINKFLSDYVSSLPRRIDEQLKELKAKIKQIEDNKKTFKEKEYEIQHIGYVYLIKLGDSYKIGITKNTEERFKQFEFMPFELKIIKTAKVKEYDKVEKFLHEQYSSKRIKGEWFNLSQEDIQNIIDYLTEIEVSL